MFDRLMRQKVTKEIKRRMETDWNRWKRTDAGENHEDEEEDEEEDDDDDEEGTPKGLLILNEENYDSTIKKHKHLLVRAAYPWCKQCKISGKKGYGKNEWKHWKLARTDKHLRDRHELKLGLLDLREAGAGGRLRKLFMPPETAGCSPSSCFSQLWLIQHAEKPVHWDKFGGLYETKSDRSAAAFMRYMRRTVQDVPAVVTSFKDAKALIDDGATEASDGFISVLGVFDSEQHASEMHAFNVAANLGRAEGDQNMHQRFSYGVVTDQRLLPSLSMQDFLEKLLPNTTAVPTAPAIIMLKRFPNEGESLRVFWGQVGKLSSATSYAVYGQKKGDEWSVEKIKNFVLTNQFPIMGLLDSSGLIDGNVTMDSEDVKLAQREKNLPVGHFFVDDKTKPAIMKKYQVVAQILHREMSFVYHNVHRKDYESFLLDWGLSKHLVPVFGIDKREVYKLKDNHGNYEERGIFPWSDNVRTQETVENAPIEDILAFCRSVAGIIQEGEEGYVEVEVAIRSEPLPVEPAGGRKPGDPLIVVGRTFSGMVLDSPDPMLLEIQFYANHSTNMPKQVLERLGEGLKSTPLRVATFNKDRNGFPEEIKELTIWTDLRNLWARSQRSVLVLFSGQPMNGDIYEAENRNAGAIMQFVLERVGQFAEDSPLVALLEEARSDIVELDEADAKKAEGLMREQRILEDHRKHEEEAKAQAEEANEVGDAEKESVEAEDSKQIEDEVKEKREL